MGRRKGKVVTDMERNTMVMTIFGRKTRMDMEWIGCAQVRRPWTVAHS
jgi:hypothetical protein